MHVPEPADTPDPREILRQRAQQKLEANARNMAKLQRDKRKLPWLLLILILTIPAGFLWGFRGVLIVLGGTVFTLSSAFYLWWGHAVEYQQKDAALRAELKKLSA